MATRIEHQLELDTPPSLVRGSLLRADQAILGPRRDAILFWGAPLAAFLLVHLWLRGWDALAPAGQLETPVAALFAAVGLLTWGHLIAVVPRAYLNPDVFAAHRGRLTIVPAVLLAGLLLSPTLLLIAIVAAIFWDVHHSAMQNFGFARLYDMKAGTSPTLLRGADLRLNWVLYVGPIFAGAAAMTHLEHFREFDGSSIAALAAIPGVFEANSALIRWSAAGCCAAVLGWAALDYARAIAAGYRIPAYKLATLVSSGSVSILAWGFSPPVVALAVINLYHAVQYFALVWVKEGGRMSRGATDRRRQLLAFAIFAAGCGLFALGYWRATEGDAKWLLAPFIACSLLHFWYDGFVWSVRKRPV